MKEALRQREILIERLSEWDESLMEKFVEGQEVSELELKRAVQRRDPSDERNPCSYAAPPSGIKVSSLCSMPSLTYLPSPLDVPPVKGVDLKGQDLSFSANNGHPLSALAFKIMNDPYTGQLTFFRIYSGSLKSRRFSLQCYERETRTDRASLEDACQQAGGDSRGLGRRYLCRGGPETYNDGRYDLQ